jgi:hypothetical protein
LDYGWNLNTARQQVAGAGIQTATLAFGGASPTIVGNTESYNGTSWTELNDLTLQEAGASSRSINTLHLAFGGDTSPRCYCSCK